MTATQPDSDGGITRRGVMRGAAIGIGATAAGGVGTKYAGSPVGNAEAVAPLALIGAGAGLVAAGAAIVSYGESISGPDDSEVADSLEWQAHVDEFLRAREDELILDQTLASLERDIQLVENKAREEAIFRVYEQGVDSGSEDDATAEAEGAVNEAYATVQKSIYNSWNMRANRTEKMLDLGVVNDPDLNLTGPLADAWSDTTVSDYEGNDITYRAATESGNDYNSNGDYTFYDYYEFDPNPEVYEDIDDKDDPDNTDVVDSRVINKPDPDDYESVDGEDALDVSYEEATVIDTSRWNSLLEDLDAEHSAMMDEVSSIVDSYYQPAADGEIDLTDIQGPQHLTDAADNAENYGEAALALDAMGFSLATSASILSVEVDGETSEFTGMLARTVDNPNPLPVGSEIDPSEVTGSIYAALNQENDDGETSGAIVEVTEPFVIEEAEDGSDEITFEKRELAEADSLTNEEIQDLFAENYQSREDARDTVYETSTGGGGGFLSGSSDAQTLGIVAGGAALAALLFGNN